MNLNHARGKNCTARRYFSTVRNNQSGCRWLIKVKWTCYITTLSPPSYSKIASHTYYSHPMTSQPYHDIHLSWAHACCVRIDSSLISTVLYDGCDYSPTNHQSLTVQLTHMTLLEFGDCGKHCRSWEFWDSGLDRRFRFVLVFFTCLQGAVLHWPNGIQWHSESGTGAHRKIQQTSLCCCFQDLEDAYIIVGLLHYLS